MITSYYENALLSDASYADLDEISNIQLNDALIDSGFTPTQASDFTGQWRLVDHQPDTTSGFSATLFERLDDSGNGAGRFTLAMRGTMGIVDIAEFVWKVLEFSGLNSGGYEGSYYPEDNIVESADNKIKACMVTS